MRADEGKPDVSRHSPLAGEDDTVDESQAVTVIGGGVSGLATAVELRSRGVQAVVLESLPQPGQSWLDRYDSLKLNSVRWYSGFRGHPIPRASGRYVRREDFAGYIANYARTQGINFVPCVALQVERSRGHWATISSEGTFVSRHLVVATGMMSQPRLPAWFDQSATQMRLLHSSGYRRASDFEGQAVLVVGAGNSGAEIATDLLRGRRLGTVSVAIRTPPNIMPRDLWGLPLQNFAVPSRYQPLTMQDQTGRVVQHVALGDLGKTPIGRSPAGMFSRLKSDGVSPTVDDGFVQAVRDGTIEIVDAIDSLDGAHARTASGRLVAADAVIVATGYRPGLENLLGGLGVLDENGFPPQYGAQCKLWRAAGLHFVGFSSPLSGHLRECTILARRAARAIERAEARSGGAENATGSKPSAERSAHA
jgi:putative flavoprotein involved in K+ transport